MIQTVLGAILPEQLGFCHSHEHIFIAGGQPEKINPVLKIDDFSKSLDELRVFKVSGGKAMVDAQPLGCGRIEQWLVDASEQANVHIIAATGFHKLSFYPESHWIYRFNQDQLAHLFRSEINNGMFVGTDTAEPNNWIPEKAGVIKIAVDQLRIEDPDKRWFEASAQAAKETGVALLCHIESAEQAEWLVDFYLIRGIRPSQLIICHLDRTLDNFELHCRLAKLGVVLEYDTIGRYKYHSDKEEAAWIARMIKLGYGGNLLLGLDTTRARLKSYGGEIGWLYIRESFIPLLHEAGITNQEINVMMVDNPAKAFNRISNNE